MRSEGSVEPTRRFTERPDRTPTYPELLQVMNHPLRRRILRTLHEVGEARSPRELSRLFSAPVSNVSYHIKVLKEKGAIALTDRRQVRGSAEHFYFSVLAGDSLAIELLRSTAAEDRAS